MKKEMIIQPMITDENVFVQFSDTVVTDKFLTVKVPNGFQALVFIDESLAFKINTCTGKKFLDYGKDYLNRQCKIAFLRTKLLPQLLWGLGPIQVNNDRLKEAYRIGSNGTYSIEIAEPGRLINCFDNKINITKDLIREKTKGIITNIGTSILGSYFANTDISVFEISSLTAEIRQQMFNALKDEKAFSELGLRLTDFIVNTIHVNEDDLELIRNRINSAKGQPQKDEDNTIDYMEELRRAQKEIANELTEKFNEQLKNFQDVIVSDMEEKMQELLPLQESAKDSYVEKVQLTAKSIIENATSDDDFIPAAAMMYSNVEDNLINKFHLRHENKTFVIDYQEYCEIAESAKIGDYFVLKKRNPQTGELETFIPRPVNGNPALVEMLPIVRFIKAGLDTESAKQASEFWVVLNKIRHKSEENVASLNNRFANISEKKKYLLHALDFFKSHGLCTKD